MTEPLSVPTSRRMIGAAAGLMAVALLASACGSDGVSGGTSAATTVEVGAVPELSRPPLRGVLALLSGLMLFVVAGVIGAGSWPC